MNHPELLTTKINKSRKLISNNLLVGVGIIFILSLLIIGYSLLKQSGNNGIEEIGENLTNFSNPKIDTRSWRIAAIEPAEGSAVFNVSLKSNIGNLRSYNNLSSFGLSKDGSFLAINSAEGIQIIDLNQNTKKNADVPSSKYYGDLAESISWDGDKFALSVIYEEGGSTAVWVFDKDGKILKEIFISIPYRDAQGRSAVEPVKVSSESEYILVRTYKKEDLEFTKEDGTKYSIYELPIYLNIFSLEGKQIKEINVSDYSNGEKDLYYAWDESGMIKYHYFDLGYKPDLTRDYLFTKVSIDE